MSIEWIDAKVTSIPKDGKEYLTKNENQGNNLQLVYYDKIHKCYTNKGEYVFEGNAGTHWKHITI